MKNEEIKNLALILAMSETETEVVKHLNSVGLWLNRENWKEVDDSAGNWSTIGNQQSEPDKALVEKIINSVDAVLMRECLIRGIDPESKEAPKNIGEAQKEYFSIYNSKLSSVDARVRSELAKNIFLVASGEKKSPSYSIIDLGEGQSPKCFCNTFLSLNKGNKSKVQFVQGKFGMGGTGVFRFGSPKHNLQLIISKRNQNIKDARGSDEWGITVIRRVSPTGQMKSSIFTYLAPENEILSFTAKTLPLLPDNNLNTYKKSFECGTFIKLYNYQMSTGRLRSDATRHLHNRLSLLMPDIALPIKVIDTRFEKSPIKTLSGLSVRLDEDKKENLENGFPGSGEMTIEGQKMDYSIFAFKDGKRETYAKEEGILFTLNGQTQGFLSRHFFDRKAVGMNYLSDSILMIIDCSNISKRMQEDLFMNSRDRLGTGPIRVKIEQQLEDIIKNHRGLRDLKDERRRERQKNQIEDPRPLVNVLEDMIKKSPSLASLFMKGIRIKNPFNLTGVTRQEEFKGKEFPSYFKLVKKFLKEKSKICPINRKFRVQYETDVENEYFKRDREPGEFILKVNENLIEEYSLNLWKGLATLNINIPESAKVGDKLCFQTEVIDSSRASSFLDEFYIEVAEQQSKKTGRSGERKQSPGEEIGEGRKKPTDYLDIPKATEVRRDSWGQHNFNEKSALRVIDAGEESGYDFYINMDNIYLQAEIKGNPKVEPGLLGLRFKFGMILIGMSLLSFDDKNKKNEEISLQNQESISVYDKISMFSEAISPTLLPMIAELGSIELEL